MKTTSDFSWTKLLCFFGAGLAVFFAFVNFGSAGILINAGNGFNGVCTGISAIGWLGVAFGLYKYYQKWDSKDKLGEIIIKDKKSE